MIAIIQTNFSDPKAFPYDITWQSACFPVGNIANIKRIINLLKEEKIINIRVILSDRACDVKATLFDEKNITYYASLKEAVNDSPEAIYLNATCYFSKNDLKRLIASSSKAVALTKPVSRFETSIDSFGVRIIDQKIIDIYGHARAHYVDELLAGIYKIPADFWENLDSTPIGVTRIVSGTMPPQNFFFENFLQTCLIRNKSISALTANDSVLDIMMPFHLLEANTLEAKNYNYQKMSTVKIDESCHINGILMCGNNVIIENNVTIDGNCIVGDNTVIRNGVLLEGNNIIGADSTIQNYAKINQNTVIGNHCKIGFNAEIGGLMMDGASAVHTSEITGIIGRYVDVAAQCVSGMLRFDDGLSNIVIDSKRYTSLYTNFVFIGDYTRLGINNILYPGIRIGSYCAVGPGAILEKDIAHNTLVKVIQEKEYKLWNIARYGWK